ncbi:hypothetical protein BJ875DRAFT_370457 [Amylocarpus encephaloides]|uniref:PHD and RING finger domain-containing protein n=1 Tax=Amylocarpus encephaloides TaxID=45428 RepID=A0A9P7YQC9_9HELO|nr:hypothetical protein BJ875DRAFT_370457 [Amylocarpus encephaloides]
MADQCIVCLEDLSVSSGPDARIFEEGSVPTDAPSKQPANANKQLPIAVIKTCGHCLHDECLKEWIQKANSCPFCRQSFNLVEVLDKVGGAFLSEYAVEDRKQVAPVEFDPAWLEEVDEEEDNTVCPICDGSDNEDVLLLCDACNAPYHTYCVGISEVPSGSWFCMECRSDGTEARALELRDIQPPNRAPARTQSTVRRHRRRIREDHWVGAWSVFSSRVHDVVGLDLDFSDEEDAAIGAYRQTQRQNSTRAREFQQWQQRINIAGRQGARAVFQSVPRPIRPRTPPTPVESREESRAWGAFEKAKELDGAPRTRKRKSKSAATSTTASPVEPSESREPERKLKRPRTRRVLVEGEASSSSAQQPSRTSNPPQRPVSPNRPESHDVSGRPSFLSSLLKEVEGGATSDEDRSIFSSTTISGGNRVTSPSIEQSSPAASPSPSTSHTPRGLSITPPPHLARRYASPRPLTSRVDPRYSYSPNRSPGESTAAPRPSSPTTELRQPRPRRQKPRPLALARSPDTSPVRATMSAEAKDSINKIVKYALAPHWKSAEITSTQYAAINRDVSRKLYEIVADKDISEEREKWEKMASNEVATAVQGVRN